MTFPGGKLHILSFREKCFSDVEETGETYLENSRKKARAISEETGLPVLSDDSGLEVSALDGAPGVHSARFAGPDSTDRENLNLLLEKLQGRSDREARFITVATLYMSSEEGYFTRGTLEGRITREPRGNTGFGYDPVFMPNGYDRTLAQLGQPEKNRISHRRKALEKMKDKLRGILRKK